MKKKLCSFVLVFAMIIALVPCVHAATVIDSGTCGDNLTWSLDSDGTLTFKGTGEMNDYVLDSSPAWKKYGKDTKKIIFGSGVTSIGNNAFNYFRCDNLKSLVIPDNITRIGRCAFWGCSELKEISIGNGVTDIGYAAFNYCSSLTSITIPGSVTTLGGWEFGNCTGLKSVTLGYGMTTIGETMFSDCTALTSIDIPNSVTSIGYQAFKNCSSLAEINIPNSVTELSGGAFYGCNSLTSLTLPGSITSLSLFCPDGVKNLVIGSGTTSVNVSSNGNLEHISIPDTVTDFNTEPLQIITNLISIDVDPNNSTYASVDGILFNKDLTTLYKYPAAKNNLIYKIPDSVTKICLAAFRDTSLSAIFIPKSVTKIESDLVYGAANLTDIYYGGTEDDWNNIDIDNEYNIEGGEWSNQDLLSKNIHYSSAEVPEPSIISANLNNNKINVEVENIPYSCKLVTALYNNGIMTQVKTTNLYSGNTFKTVTVTADGADSAKVFIWDSLERMKPLCDVKEITEIN